MTRASTPTHRRKDFRPLNTLASPHKPKFVHTSLVLEDFHVRNPINGLTYQRPSLKHKSEGSAETGARLLAAMVKERSPSKATSSQYLSSEGPGRAPLANISAKMQSPSPKQIANKDAAQIAKPPTQPEFGKSSPLRNPLKKQEPNLFIPKAKPVVRASSSTSIHAPQDVQTAQVHTSTAPIVNKDFYLPGQRPSYPHAPAQQSLYPATSSSWAKQTFKRSFDPDVVEIAKPVNAPLQSLQPRPQPMFSSLGPNTYHRPYAPQKDVVDLTGSLNNDDRFDPDAEIREQSRKFGEPDPYMYIDSSKANENVKNLLEGAFDNEEDKSKTRLRRRAKKAVDEGEHKSTKGLSSKLAALSVKEEAANSGAAEEQAEEDDEEDGTVEGLNVKLLPHQVEGVAWMIDKEMGVRKKKGVLPNGGILADDMGLGKTIQSMTLILTNPRPGPDAKPEHKHHQLPGEQVSKCTLIIAPLALIKQWQDEIKTKVSKSHALRVLVHHGPSRTKSFAELKKYDVVITTYQTITSEHAASDMNTAKGTRIGCFGVHWYRIVLDEAHSIKNRNAKSTLAACALESFYRWCLTGTPMQNNLDELQSLIKFLRIKPYCELREWKDAITTPMKNGRGGLAMKRLQVFLRAFMKRRTKDILKKEGALNFGGKATKELEYGADGEVKKQEGMKIVKREVLTVDCDFDEMELEFYDRLQARADVRLRELTKNGKQDYIGALVLLLRLRQACDHPQLIEMAMNKDKDAMTTGVGSQGGIGTRTPSKQNRGDDADIDALTALMGGVSVQTKLCDVCQITLSSQEARDDNVRCGECEADLARVKQSSKKSKKVQAKKESRRTQKTHKRIIEDGSDDEDGDEGRWIAEGPEQHIDLGVAGGTDDEDAEGGGESLASIDSTRSADNDQDEDDSPPRARARRRALGAKKPVNDDGGNDSDEGSDESGSSISDTPVLEGMAPSSKAHGTPSTKIRQLLRILHAEVAKHKFIVFSQFTTMLDLIEPHLHNSNLRFARYDGSMRPDAREVSLNALRTDPKCRILLCSLKCGSLGLNLTAASRVVIVEPFWNPFVEEQAIDRVHRLNQTIDVKVFRLTVRNTVEARILELQEKKRELAAAAIEGGTAVGKLSMKDILSLFHHDAEQGHHDPIDKQMWQKFGPSGADGRHQNYEQAENLMERDRRGKPGKEKLFREHDVFGRRW